MNKLRTIILFSIICFIYIGCSERVPSGIKIKEEKNTLIGGSMAFDGTYLWTTSITRGFKKNAKQKIIKIDKNGEIVDSFEPEENISSDLAFDGKTLWTAYAFGWETGRSYSDHGVIYRLNPKTKELNIDFTISEYFDDLEGMTATPGTLWVMVSDRDEEDNRIELLYEISISSGDIVNTYRFTEFTTCCGIAYLEGNIWALTGLFLKKVIKINLSNGEIEGELDFQGKVINGITSMNGRIYLFDEKKDLLFCM